MPNLLTTSVAATERSVVRQLEDLLPQIEDGLARGYSHAVMHAALPALGINISLAYYHRALRLLRQERKEGKRLQGPQELVPAPLGEMSPPAEYHGTASPSNLSGPIVEKAADHIGNISPEPNKALPFRWKGQEFLNKDWSNF